MSEELGFYTTRELIEELMSRETFLGIVIKSINEITTVGDVQQINPGGFEVRCKNMSPDQASSLLSGVSACIEKEVDDDWQG